MTSHKAIRWVVPIGVLLVSAALGVFGIGHQNALHNTQTDIIALRHVGAMASEGVSPYNRVAVVQAASHLPFTVDELFYPPSAIPLLVLLGSLDTTLIRVLAVVVQVLCAVYLVYRYQPNEREQNAPVNVSTVARKLPLTLFCPVLLLALYQTVRAGQVSCVVVVAALIFWKLYHDRSSATTWFRMLALCVATMKPSITLPVVIFLALDRAFLLLIGAAALHVLLLCSATALTGIDPVSLLKQWLSVLATYRDLPQNDPSGEFVYGLSSLLTRILGKAPSLEVLALPGTYLVWRARSQLSLQQSIALLLVVAFVSGAPHAYDFFMLVPGLLCLLESNRGVLHYLLASAMLLVPQRLVELMGGRSFDSVFRVLAPVGILAGIVSIVRRRGAAR
jgi:hypothetical protein